MSTKIKRTKCISYSQISCASLNNLNYSKVTNRVCGGKGESLFKGFLVYLLSFSLVLVDRLILIVVLV